MTKVLDASALIAYLEREPGYQKVQGALAKAAEEDKTILMNAVNWGEVYYILARDYDLKKAREIARLVETFPVEIVPADKELAEQAALFKATKSLPYADCFAAALAYLHHGELITGDKEFRLVEDEVKILWLH